MPRPAVVELPDGNTSWAGCTGGPSGLGALVARPGWVHWWPVRAGCTGGPSGLGALVARPGWVHWWPVRAGCTGGPSGLGAPVARPGWVHRWPRPAALSSVDRVRQGFQRVRRRALAGRDGRAARPAPAAGGPALAGRRATGGRGSAVVGGLARPG